MLIHFACASCSTVHQAETRLAGRTLKCFKCGNLFIVPAEAPVRALAPPTTHPPVPVRKPAIIPPTAVPAPLRPPQAAPRPVPIEPVPTPMPVDTRLQDEDDGDLFAEHRRKPTPLASAHDSAIDSADMRDDDPTGAVPHQHDPAAGVRDFGSAAEPELLEDLEVLEVLDEIEEPAPPPKKKGRGG